MNKLRNPTSSSQLNVRNLPAVDLRGRTITSCTTTCTVSSVASASTTTTTTTANVDDDRDDLILVGTSSTRTSRSSTTRTWVGITAQLNDGCAAATAGVSWSRAATIGNAKVIPHDRGIRADLVVVVGLDCGRGRGRSGRG